MKRLYEYIRNNYIGFIIWAAFSLLTGMLIFPQLSVDYINYDSSYQYFLTQHSMGELLSLLPEDYSPPFYAVTLKLFTMLFGETLYMMRVFNLIAAVGMLHLAAFPVRRMFGMKASVLCAVLATVSGVNLSLLPETRPTFFAMYLFMAVGVYSYSALFEGTRSAYVLLTVYSVIAMYTHNVAMLGTLAVYITMLVFALIIRDRRGFKNIFICGVVCAVVYIPWLFVVLYQFGNVQDGFWSSSMPSIVTLFSWTFSSPFEYYTDMPLRILLLVAAAATLAAIALKNLRISKLRSLIKPDDSERITPFVRAMYLLCSYVMAVALLFLFTVFVYPFAASRYFNIFSGYIYVIIAAGLAVCGLKVMPWALAAVCGLVFGAEVGKYGTPEITEQAEPIHEMVEDIGEDAEFLHYHEWSLGTMSYYFPEGVHYVSDDTFTVLQTYEVFTTDVVDVEEMPEIEEYTDDFYVLVSDRMDGYLAEDVLEQLESDLPDAEIESVGEYIVPETYLADFELYHVTI